MLLLERVVARLIGTIVKRMNSFPKSERHRIVYLDSLRGLAALMVAYYHFAEFYIKSNEKLNKIDLFLFNIVYKYIDFGKIGVVLFFLISGFVVPFSFNNKVNNPINNFLLARFFRLYPAYWLSLISAIFIFMYFENQKYSKFEIIMNFTMFQQYIGVRNVIGLYWTLQIEIFFYLVCCVLFKLNILYSHKTIFITSTFFLLVSLLAAVFRFYSNISVPVALPLSLAIMFFSINWRFYIIENNNAALKWLFYHFLSFYFLIIPLTFFAYSKDFGTTQTINRYVITYLLTPILFVLVTSFFRYNSFIFSYLGKISYSFYLFTPIIQVISLYYLNGLSFFQSRNFLIIISITGSILLSAIIYHCLERPFIYIGRYFQSKFSKF